MTTYRVQWTHPGSFAPEFHDFRYAEAAEHFADILREIGRQHVTTHHLPDPTDSTRRDQP